MSYRFAHASRILLKHVEFYSKNKFEKFLHLGGFIIRIYHNARSPERQINVAGTLGLLCRSYWDKFWQGFFVGFSLCFYVNMGM